MLSIMEALEQEIRNIQEPGSLRVSIAASPIPGNYLMPIKMLYFISDHPRLRYSLVIKPVEEVIDSVVDRTTNLGIVSGPISPQTMNRLSSEQIALYLLGHDEIVAICGKGSLSQENTR